MKLKKQLVLLFLILPFVSSGFIKGYYCGSGFLSTIASFLASVTCHRDRLNLCCKEHDDCYDNGNVTRDECDEVFCECSQNVEDTETCQWWIGVSHCNVVKKYGGRIYSRLRRIQNEQLQL